MGKVITIEDVAEKLQMSKSTIYKYAKNEVIPSFKIGSSRRFFEEEVDSYLVKIMKEQRKKC
jgi:excisionase family DNA binding protein